MRRSWPLIVGIAIILMVAAYLAVSAWFGSVWGGTAALVVALLVLSWTGEIPAIADAYRIGAEGERRTANYLAQLEDAGFVVLHDRRVPGYGGNLDHVAIGPSGVWVIETKSLTGRVEIDGEQLTINGRRRDNIVDQVYREAGSVQIALRDSLAGVGGVTVNPVICLHRAKRPLFHRSARGVRIVNGGELANALVSGEVTLTPEQVQGVATEANRLLASRAGGQGRR